MNAWAARHRAALESALEAGETLVAADRVVLGGVSRIELAGARAGQTVRVTRKRGPSALRAARRNGFDLPARAFVLGVTNKRILIWRASAWLARPAEFATAIALENVGGLRVVHPRFLGRVRLLLADGTMIVLRPYGGRRLDHLATEN